MALHSDYEPVRASLLHQETFPKLESVVAELLSKETHLGILKNPQFDITGQVLLATSSYSFHFEKSCNYCKQPGHLISKCRKLQRKQKEQSTQSKCLPCSSAATTNSASISISLNDLQAIFNQITGHSTISSPATTSDMNSSWYFDSRCFNHMTSSADSMANKIHSTSSSGIRTADNTEMNVTHTGDV